MRKQLIIGVVLLGALAFAAQAGAAGQTYEMNLWGASAQFQLFNQSLSNFLQGAPYYCSPVAHGDDGTLGTTTGSNCNGATPGAGTDTITIRASSKASYDGVLALQGKAKAEDIAAYPAGAAGSNFCDPVNYPAVVTPDYHYRIMYLDTTKTTKACKRVDLALSDVYPPSFTQDTNPGTTISNGTGNPRRFSNDPITAASLSGFNSYNPMIVPFAFYAHNDVTLSKCSAGIYANQQCTAGSGATSSDCPNGPLSSCTYNSTDKKYECAGGVNAGSVCKSSNDCPASYGACTAAPLDNISKIEAILIFSRQATFWTDLGMGYAGGPAATGAITACYRVAGSGTHATLDYGVMKAKGYGLATLPNAGASSTQVFNDGTGAEMTCVNGTLGAIGYADADQALSMNPLWTALGNTGNAKYASTMPLKFEGIMPSRRAIRNGEYDNFYSKEWIFQDPTSPTFTGAHSAFMLSLVTNGSTGLMDQLSTPGAIDATDRASFWAAFGETNGAVVNNEMYYMKDTDQLYPKVVAPNDGQTP